MSFADTLGFEELFKGLHVAHVRGVLTEQHTNMHGTGHGGFVYSLADEAFALASNSGDKDAVALSVHMEYFRPVSVGDALVAKASAERVGRRVATYRVEVQRVDDPAASAGEMVALFTGTVFRSERVNEPKAAGVEE